MSYTTILAAFADGRLVGFEDAKNAWHGAMTIWNWVAKNYCGMQRFPLTDLAESQKVWDVWQREEVPIDIRLAMMTTLDGVLLRADLAERVAVALETFPVETDNLQTQARAIRAAFAQGARAVGWVQNSCVDGWCGPCYNIDTDRSHHWISLEGLIQEESDEDSEEVGTC